MATINATGTNIGIGVRLYSWTPLANGDNGNSLEAAATSDKTVQVVGTFGAGGTCVVQGSNDGTNWATLTDPDGTNLSFTASGLELVRENPRYIRPNVTAGDGTTSLTVHITAKRATS